MILPLRVVQIEAIVPTTLVAQELGLIRGRMAFRTPVVRALVGVLRPARARTAGEALGTDVRILCPGGGREALDRGSHPQERPTDDRTTAKEIAPRQAQLAVQIDLLHEVVVVFHASPPE
jgi:hypothetical protein